MKKTLISVILVLLVLAACSPSVTEPVTNVLPGTEESAPTEAAATEEPAPTDAALTEESVPTEAAATEAPASSEEPAVSMTGQEVSPAIESAETIHLVDITSAPLATIEDPDGYYHLRTMFLEGENKCLEGNRLAPESVLEGAAFMDTCSGVPGQLWKITPLGDGYYQLQTQFLENENKCFESNSFSSDRFGGGSFLDDCQNASGQAWKLVESEVDGYYRLQSQFQEGENKCLEGNRLAPESVLEGAAFMDTCLNVTGQLWKLVRHEASTTETTVAAGHFEYGEDAPLHWGDLDIEENVCGTGQSQSPINISTPNGQDLVNIAFHYEPRVVKIFNNEHTVQVDYAGGGYIELDGNRYNVAQIHYHAPGEHQVDGMSYAAEFHIVHVDEKDARRFAVIGLLLEEGDANPAFEPFIENAAGAPKTHLKDEAKEVTGAMLNAAALLPEVKTTYRYKGSLTTPPCSETVQWLVMTTPVQISAEQLSVLAEISEEISATGNNRPVQPLNNRPVDEDTTD